MKESRNQRVLKQDLTLSPAQLDILQQQIDIYNKLFVEVVDWCKSNKSVNRFNAHKALYDRLRAEYPQLLSQFVIIVFREACAAVKSWNSNNPKRKWQLRSIRRSQSVMMDLRLLSLRGNLLTLSTLKGQPRTRTLLADVPSWFDERYPERKLQAATVHISHKGNPYINLIFTVPGAAPRDTGSTVGIDRGLYKLAVTSKGGEFSGSQVRSQQRKYLYNRATLQQKGTRSAKRRLKAISGKEKRFMKDVNHQITSKLAKDETVKTYVLEDLTNIRKDKRGKKGPSWVNRWSFYQFEMFLQYKCEIAGITVVEVNPRHTSQACNVCGFTNPMNRDKSKFRCLTCGHRDNADANAAKNIRDKYLSSLPQKVEQGLVNSP